MSCSVSFSLFPPSTVRRSILLLPSAFDQPSTLFLSFIQTRVSCLSSFLFPRLFVSCFLHFSRSLFCIYDSPFSHRVRPLCVISFSPSLSSILYSDCISVIRLHVCSRPAPTIQHPRMMPERKFGDFCHSICLRFSLFTVTNWYTDAALFDNWYR